MGKRLMGVPIRAKTLCVRELEVLAKKINQLIAIDNNLESSMS